MHVGQVKEVQLQTSNGEAVKIPLYTSTFSKEFEVTLEGNLLNFLLPETSSNAEPLMAASAMARETQRQLFLFLSSKKSAGAPPYRVLVFDDSENEFPMGSTRLLNLANNHVRFVIGEHSRDLKPGGVDSIPQAMKRNATNQAAVEISFQQTDGNWNPISSTRWLSLPNQRSWVIAFIHPESGRPMVHNYQDQPPWRLPKL